MKLYLVHSGSEPDIFKNQNQSMLWFLDLGTSAGAYECLLTIRDRADIYPNHLYGWALLPRSLPPPFTHYPWMHHCKISRTCSDFIYSSQMMLYPVAESLSLSIFRSSICCDPDNRTFALASVFHREFSRQGNGYNWCAYYNTSRTYTDPANSGIGGSGTIVRLRSQP